MAMAVVGVVVVTAGCTLRPEALDGPIAVELHVTTTPTSVEVDAPGWFADTSGIFLCPLEPAALPDPGPERIGWTPGPACHGFGTRPSRDGLKVSLPLAELSDTTASAFAAADDWYLLLLDIEGDRVTSAVRSRFTAPDDVAAS
ncbi:MAG: hypothetical protein ABIQ58_09105 [Candidatus Limnocylindrales bacterium]